ncbi:unnamed protein product [Symbiodinium natans]|uniref:Pentacotripeptide-repeat region of PRORP domain-containing protein n=1 Tax=Symbiodinium natans TaxID=878477 RepID=A0A812TK05_9DINO|nr:unnamed protein product [Symbiodinium natans]
MLDADGILLQPLRSCLPQASQPGRTATQSLELGQGLRRVARGQSGLKSFCVLWAVGASALLWGKPSIQFSSAVPEHRRNASNEAGPGRPRKPSRFYTSAASQSSTDYLLTKGEARLLQQVNEAATRSDWQRIQQLRATSKVHKTPFFDVEMNAALGCGQYRAGVALYERLCNLELNKEVLTFNLALKLYGKTGNWSSVKQVWQEARAAYRMDETMAAARLVAAADEGDIRTAAEVLDEMVQMNLSADVGHFTSALRACTAAEHKAYNAAMFLFNSMLNMSLTPDVQVFTALISTFAGRPVSDFQRIRHEMDELGVQPTWLFADAYLKALFSVPQKDRRLSLAELAELLSGLSTEHLQEAVLALSKFEAVEKEWSAFCQVSKLALRRHGL